MPLNSLRDETEEKERENSEGKVQCYFFGRTLTGAGYTRE